MAKPVGSEMVTSKDNREVEQTQISYGVHVTIINNKY